MSDESKRRQYDQYGHAAFTNASGGFSGFDGFDFNGMEDIFGDLFGNMFGGRSSRSSSNRRQDGADLLYRMTISFDEAVHGTKRDIKVEVEDECDNCKGQGGFGSHTCPECKGTGTVTKQQSTMFGSFYLELLVVIVVVLVLLLIEFVLIAMVRVELLNLKLLLLLFLRE